MSTFSRLSRPARVLLACLLVLGLTGAVLTSVNASLDESTEAVRRWPVRLVPSRPPAPMPVAASSTPLTGPTHLWVDPPVAANSWIAFSAVEADGEPGLYLLAPDGSVVRRIAEGDAAQRERAWSWHGRAIVFCGSTGGSPSAPDSECMGTAETGFSRTSYFRRAKFLDTRPVPSPNRRSAAVVRVHEGPPGSAAVLVVDLATGRSSVLVDFRDNAGLAIDWSPDGSSIAYSSAPNWGVENLWITSVDGHRRRRLTDLPPDQEASAPTFSPDGEWIVFRLLGDGAPKIMRIRPDGSGLALVAELPTAAPRWLDWSPVYITKQDFGWISPPGTGGRAIRPI